MNFKKYNSGIYKLTSPSGKIYIGQTTDAVVRHSKYRCLKCFSQPKLYNSLVKYGFDAHKVEWLVVCNDLPNLNRLETYFIRLYDSMNNGLNCTEGGDSRKVSEETKLKMSKAFMNRSEEYKQKIIESRYVRVMSEETRKKISETKKGSVCSEETRKKLSIVGKGKTISEEHKGKISMANKGKAKSEEHRLKISASSKGKVCSEETRRKMSESARNRKESK